MLKLMLHKELKTYFSSHIIWYVLALSLTIPVLTISISLINPNVFTVQTISYSLMFEKELEDKLALLTSTQSLRMLILFSSLPLLISILGGYTALASAAKSFAGEKESKTIEILLALPISDRLIFLGKILSSMILGFISAMLVAAITILGIEINYYLITRDWFGVIFSSYFHVTLALAVSAILISSMVGTILSGRIKNVIAALYAGGIVPALPVLVIILFSTYNPQINIVSLVWRMTFVISAFFPLLTLFVNRLLRRERLIS
ncbi:MAG: ABC-2 family transporter protein [Candidatus Bathyarchaeota archaeon BA2]|nr:MAG: ABC-2 family transporter protein [Candidatus Bathyarchaeota archaeon BA2]